MEKQILGQIHGNRSHWHNPCDSASVSAFVVGNLRELRAKMAALGPSCPRSPIPKVLGVWLGFLICLKVNASVPYCDDLTVYSPQMKMLPWDQNCQQRRFFKNSFILSNKTKNDGFR